MAENQRRILEMLEQKKITVEEAERLLSLTGSEEVNGDTPAGQATEKKRKAKYLRVVVQPDVESGSAGGGDRVNARVPMSLIRAGMKLATLIPQLAADEVNEALMEEGVDFDMRNIKPGDVEELIEALSDWDVDVHSDSGEHERVFAE